MQIILANGSGYCFGVKRAMAMAGKAANDFGCVYSLGPLIHNPREVERLSSHIVPVADFNGLDEGVVVIRTHGVGPQIFREAREKGFQLVDATCPFVRKAQNLVANLSAQGYRVLIVGDKSHPEVEGLVSWSAGKATVLESAEDVAKLPYGYSKIGVIAQTTQLKKHYEQILNLVREKYPQAEIKEYDTVCLATAKRQQAAYDLAKRAEMMIVIGGKNSANTRNLAELCRKTGVFVQICEGADDLPDKTIFQGKNKIGVCAGASTPDWIIEEVVAKMLEKEKEIGNEVEVVNEQVQEEQTSGMEIQEDLPAVEVPADVAAATQEDEEEQSFADAYTQEDLKNIYRGARVKGTVVQVNDNEVLVDIGGKSEGILPSTEMVREEAEKIREAFSVGQEIEVIVLKRENKEGYPVLSKKRVDQEIIWEKLQNAKAGNETVSGVVVETVKGGLLVDVGIRGFVPASLVDINFVENLETMVGKTLRMKVIECERSRNKLVLSPKAVLQEEARLRREKTWQELEEGQVREGVVRRITNFGAFVDIGGVDGLLHVSSMAWYRVNHPSDLLKEGDVIQVYVLSVDKEGGKISLSLKQLTPNPWSLAAEKYPLGSIISAKIVRTASFGAFAQVEPGIEGLIHISHLARKRVEKTEDVVQPGQEVQVKVLAVDPENKRISLSIREALPPEEEPVAPAMPAQPEEQEEPAPEVVSEETMTTSLGEIFAKAVEEQNTEKAE